ncbi:cfem domain-containing protein [Stemphylium lycopersici]|uniref:Cfem domain-containing protein n=1 Tax=Stemphylium lycopersici TaxID=183478 RepID=A0A364NDA7_STELY|nr:cfem domain-containing protein [Stemphylium lycopersici]RAR15294.1 cfem domain-containing protein [Stemphylium lycopersici]
MARSQKVATIALFASGFICVGFATLRVVQIGSTSGGNTSPSPTWLALWTIIEAGVALCIGCGPAFAVFYRRTQTLNVSYDTHGYFRHPQSCSGVDPSCPNAIKMSSVTISTGRKRASRRDTYWEDTRSSQEELAAEGKGITVTTTLEQNHRRSKTTER